MPAQKPEEVDLQLAQAINAGDLEAALALYEPGACFVAEPGKVVCGAAALREVLSGLLAMKPTLTIEVPAVVENGDLALTVSRWTLRGTGADGSPTMLEGRGAEVVRRQPDGTWKFLIDNPNVCG